MLAYFFSDDFHTEKPVQGNSYMSINFYIGAVNIQKVDTQELQL